MPGSNETETFTLRIDSNAAKTAKEDAAELANLQKRFESSANSLKQLESAYKRLNQGGVVNIQTAKDLKTKIDAEKASLSGLTDKMHAAGTSFEKLSESTKKNKERTDEANKATLALADAAGGVLVAALLAVDAAAIGATYALAKFVLESTNLARSQNLARAAVTGSVEDAQRLGTQVDALALKVPTAKAKINDLAVDMRRAGLGGQVLVDTLNATTQAAAALDDAAGSKVRELVDRGKTTGRFTLGRLETKNTGLPEFNEVAAQLAKNLKVGIADAQQALVEGRVSLGDGAKAMRDAVEKKFGGLNLAKMLDLDVMKQKFHELLQTLTANVNLEPLLNALKDFFSLFDQSTVAGAALQKLVTVFGNGFITVASKGLPLVKGFFEGLILVALDLYIAVLKLQLRFKDTFGDKKLLDNIDLVKTGVEAAKIAVVALAVVFGVLAVTTLLALSPLIILGAIIGVIAFAFYSVYENISDAIDAIESFGKTAWDSISGIDWAGLGKTILDGLLAPLNALEDKGKTLGKDLAKGFKSALGIASPSKVFEGFGENTAAGFERGVDRGTPSASDQLEAMATPRGANGSGAGGGVTVSVTVHIHVGDKATAESLAKDRNFLDAITHAVERGAMSVGQKAAA